MRGTCRICEHGRHRHRHVGASGGAVFAKLGMVCEPRQHVFGRSTNQWLFVDHPVRPGAPAKPVGWLLQPRPRLLRQGDDDRAVAEFNEAIRLDPKFASAYSSRGLGYDHKASTRSITRCTAAACRACASCRGPSRQHPLA